MRKHREVVPYGCAACGGDIYKGEEILSDNSGNAYHLDKKCLAGAVKDNLILLDELSMIDLLKRCCQGIIEEAVW